MKRGVVVIGGLVVVGAAVLAVVLLTRDEPADGDSSSVAAREACDFFETETAEAIAAWWEEWERALPELSEIAPSERQAIDEKAEAVAESLLSLQDLAGKAAAGDDRWAELNREVGALRTDFYRAWDTDEVFLDGVYLVDAECAAVPSG